MLRSPAPSPRDHRGDANNTSPFAAPTSPLVIDTTANALAEADARKKSLLPKNKFLTPLVASAASSYSTTLYLLSSNHVTHLVWFQVYFVIVLVAVTLKVLWHLHDERKDWTYRLGFAFFALWIASDLLLAYMAFFGRFVFIRVLLLDLSAIAVDRLVIRYATVNGEPSRVGAASRSGGHHSGQHPRGGGGPRWLGRRIVDLFGTLDFTKYEVAQSFSNAFRAVTAVLVASVLYGAF